MKINKLSFITALAAVIVSFSFYSCENISTNTNYENYIYQSTLDKQIRVYIQNGEVLPESRWSSTVINYINNHDSIRTGKLKFQNGKIFYYVYEMIGLEFSLHGDSIIVPLTGIGTTTTHIGYKRNDEVDIHVFSYNLKHDTKFLYSANFNTVSMDEYIASKEPEISNLGQSDTLVIVKSIFRYKKK